MPAAQTQALDLPAALDRLKQALSRGLPAEADAALQPLIGHPALPAAALDTAIRQLAQYWLSQRDWARADQGFSRLSALEPADRLQQNFARNFSALQASRPDLAQTLLAHQNSDETPRYRVVSGSDGRTLMAERQDTDATQGPTHAIVSPGEQWNAFREQALQSITEKPDQPIVLLGIGDGYAVLFSRVFRSNVLARVVDVFRGTVVANIDLGLIEEANLERCSWIADGKLLIPTFRTLGGRRQKIEAFDLLTGRPAWTCPTPESENLRSIALADGVSACTR